MAKNINIADITDVTLLTKEQWEEVIATVPNIPIETNWWWWTSSPAVSDNGTPKVWCVGREGEMHRYNASYGNCGIRPLITVFDPGADPGEKVTIGLNCTGTVVGKKTVLVDKIIAVRRFDENSSSYGDSEIKTFVETEVLKILKEDIHELFQ